MTGLKLKGIHLGDIDDRRRRARDPALPEHRRCTPEEFDLAIRVIKAINAEQAAKAKPRRKRKP